MVVFEWENNERENGSSSGFGWKWPQKLNLPSNEVEKEAWEAQALETWEAWEAEHFSGEAHDGLMDLAAGDSQEAGEAREKLWKA
eukprot:7594891-Alexandrium_andersonii.AAC.1